MDIPRKIEIADQAVRSISHHRDEDAAVRKAALDAVAALIERERAAIDAEIAERIAQVAPAV